MYVSRLVIRNFRNFAHLDVKLSGGVNCVIGENNTGKTNLLHAIRLALDSNLSSQFRQLIEHDIHSAADLTKPDQVVVSLEFSDYKERENECALVGCWEVKDEVARLSYRFRPKQTVREEIEAEEREPKNLTLDDYHWEITGGGTNDPADVDWDKELGKSIRFADLQSFLVTFLPALRDVQQDLRHSYISPLGRLLAASDIPQEEKQALVDILSKANEKVAAHKTIHEVGEAIHNSFAATAGEAFPTDVRLGMADPSFSSISRSLTMLLSNDGLKDFDPSRNGLGLNNILYVSLILEYFARRVASAKASGQLLLVEEPEAHLHPQLQRVLYTALSKKPFQTILTTHSTHISSHAPVETFVVLTNEGRPSINACVPAADGGLEPEEIADLDRYLDATRSTLLFSRKVILVEGPAELFLIPVLVRKVMNIDLDRHGISVVPIFGVHFQVYAKLFGEHRIHKKCAIIADGDLSPSDAFGGEAEDQPPSAPSLKELENEFVRVFQCKTTFERAITLPATLQMLSDAAQDCSAPVAAKKLQAACKRLKNVDVGKEPHKTELSNLKTLVLNTSKRFGKARFSQSASKHADTAKTIPKYIADAVNWLMEP